MAYTGEGPFLRTATTVIGVKGSALIVYVKRENAAEFISVDGLIEARSRCRPAFAMRNCQRR